MKKLKLSDLLTLTNLRENHEKINDIALQLNRSYNSICFLTHYYSLPTNKWSELENEILRNEYLKIPAKLLAKKLNRSPHSIYVQAGKLGLRKNNKK